MIDLKDNMGGCYDWIIWEDVMIDQLDNMGGCSD